jgi:hypothetical protein
MKIDQMILLYTRWESIKKFGQLPVMRPSGIVLAVVPILVYIYQLVGRTSSDLLSASEYLTIPRTLIYGYFSAIVLIIAKVIYNISCPELIRDYSPSDADKYVDDKAGDTNSKMELVHHIRNAFHIEGNRIRNILRMDNTETFEEVVKNQSERQLFSAARESVQYMRQFFRLACIGLYVIGFGLVFFKVFIPQLYRMYNAVVFLL